MEANFTEKWWQWGGCTLYQQLSDALEVWHPRQSPSSLAFIAACTNSACPTGVPKIMTRPNSRPGARTPACLVGAWSTSANLDFGQLHFRVRPIRLRPISTSANFDFGQFCLPLTIHNVKIKRKRNKGGTAATTLCEERRLSVSSSSEEWVPAPMMAGRHEHGEKPIWHCGEAATLRPVLTNGGGT